MNPYVVDWTVVGTMLVAAAGFIVRVIIPGLLKLRSPSRYDEITINQAGGSLGTLLEALTAQLRELTQAFQAETQRQTEWRVEIKSLLTMRTPVFGEIVDEQRILAEKMGQLAAAVVTLQDLMKSVEERTRGSAEAIAAIRNMSSAISQLVSQRKR